MVCGIPLTIAAIVASLMLCRAVVAQSGARGAAFDLRDLVVNPGEILSGGPPKDGIPALTNPRVLAAADAKRMRQDERVIGVSVGREARAYPLSILNHHEIVNDTLGGVPVAVTYCPLCDSAAVFDRRTPLGLREFGVSGLLYNSNVLLYDRGGGATESLWSQGKSAGVSGPAANKSLTALPLELTTLKVWLARHPHTSVLSHETGHRRNYAANPYAGYFRSNQLMFPAKPTSDRLPEKSRVLGLWTENSARAYPETVFANGQNQLTDKFEGKAVKIEFDRDALSLRVTEADVGVQQMYAFWFAWYAFRPQTDIYQPPPGGRERSGAYRVFCQQRKNSPSPATKTLLEVIRRF